MGALVGRPLRSTLMWPGQDMASVGRPHGMRPSLMPGAASHECEPRQVGYCRPVSCCRGLLPPRWAAALTLTNPNPNPNQVGYCRPAGRAAWWHYWVARPRCQPSRRRTVVAAAQVGGGPVGRVGAQ